MNILPKPPSGVIRESTPMEIREFLTKTIETEEILSEETKMWLEKIRRFISYSGPRLKSTAKTRFGDEWRYEIEWMLTLMIQSSEKNPFNLNRGLDGEFVSAALYCLDSLKPYETKHNTKTEQIYIKLHSKLLEDKLDFDDSKMALGTIYTNPINYDIKYEAQHINPITIFCPTNYSLYSLCVIQICQILGIPIEKIVVRSLTPSRFVQEWKRDGRRLSKKIWRKLILKSDESSDKSPISLQDLIQRLHIKNKNVKSLSHTHNIPTMKLGKFDSIPVIYGDDTLPKSAIFTGGGIVKQQLLDYFSTGIINVHMGNLPHYKGMDVVHAPIMDGKNKNVGITSHLMDKSIDTGAVIQHFIIDNSRSFKSIGALRNTLSSLAPLIAVDSLCGISSGRITPKPQGSSTSRMHYYLHPRLRVSIERSIETNYEENETQTDSLSEFYSGTIESYFQ